MPWITSLTHRPKELPIRAATPTAPNRPAAPGAEPDARPVRVLVVDDHPVVCDGVRLLLRTAPGLQVVAMAESARAALATAAREQPDLVLLDVRLPDGSAPDVVRGLRAACPGVRIVLFTAHADNAVLQPTLLAGVDGCLLKDAGCTDLVAALREVMAGGRVCDPRLGTRPDLLLRERLRELSMTRREYDVVRLAATGLTNPEIAEQLALTRNTVKTYLQCAMQKLGARNRVEAIGKAHEARLL